MHWSEKVAREIIKRKPHNDVYTLAAGISPSGSVHIGNFRDIATVYFVGQSLVKLGKRVRMLFSWDEYDRFRKVPKNISEIDPGFDKCLGLPYSGAPDPFGCHENFAKHFEAEFERALDAFGIEIEYIYQAKEYLSGRYSKDIIEALLKRKEIFDIIMEYKTQESTNEDRENYYPVSIYCDKCGKDNTKILSLDTNFVAEYSCKCGHKSSFNFNTQFNCKLAWKIDWPMRWRAEGVDFEPGGKDHASPGGSYDVSKVISDKIFNYPAPVFQGYEFIGIKGSVGKMSSSSGLNLTPETLLKIYQPEVILWLYSRNDPLKAFDFCFDDEILRHYFEFDKMLTAYLDNTASDYIREIMEVFMANRREIAAVPFSQLVSFGSVVNFDKEVLETLLNKIGMNFTKEQFSERLALAKNWLEMCSPENVIKLNALPCSEYFNALSDKERECVRTLYSRLSVGEYDLEAMRTLLYAIVTEVFGTVADDEKKKLQARFFEVIYMLLINKTAGPRLYLFLAAIDKKDYLHLLKFDV